MTDIEIAQAHEMKKIVDVAAKAGIPRMRPSPRMSRIPPTKRDSTWPRGSPASSEDP